jgi:ribosomal protein S18 acetylase RimI-like enzyme
MTTIVRLAVSADASALTALIADVQALHASALPWRFKPAGPDTLPPSEAVRLIDNPNNRVFIAETDSVPVGYAYAAIARVPESPFAFPYVMLYLHHISVRPEYRRCGAGNALLAAVCDCASSAGIDLIALDVWSFNADARAFFKRHGFAVYNERLWKRGS